MSPPKEEILTGGVASDVRIVHGADGPVVVKQALGKLKVAADWRSNPARSAVEVAALEVAAELIGSASVPRVLAVDEEANSFTMSLIEPRLRNWKAELLARRLDVRTAARAGEMLAKWHARSAGRTDLAARFADLTYFEELRLEPFFRQVARRWENLAAPIAKLMTSMTARHSALVHGDFSPKNMLVDGEEVVLLDFEVTHWGDPRFDVGFLLAHLLLKRMRGGADRAGFNALASAFLETYRKHGLSILDDALVRIMGCLILARIDGDSPVDYLGDIDADAGRRYAQQLLLDPPAQPAVLFST